MRSFKITIRFIGFALMGVCIMMMISALVAFLSHRDASMYPLLLSAGITFACGLTCLLTTKPQHNIGILDGYFIVTGCWLASGLFGALPFLFYGEVFNVINALFESISGFTTTGASILTEIESLPKGLLFWRMATSWIGGVGVVSLVSIVISSNNDRHSKLAAVELSSLAKEFYQGRRKQFVYRILTVYIGLTILVSIALQLVGVTWFDAVTHAMSACSTCGFSTKNASIASFGDLRVELILIVAMLLAGINFSLIFSTFFPNKTNRKNIFNTKIVRVFLGAVAIGIITMSIDLVVSGTYHSFGKALRVSTFQMVSIATTTGFATDDTNLWPGLCKGVIIIGSLICGCSGSTSGGIKIDRVWFALRGTREMLRSLTDPNKYDYVRLDGHAKASDEISSVIGFIMLYLMIVGIGMVVFTLGEMDFSTGMSASIACVGNVGPGFGPIGSMGNYAGLSTFQKGFSVILMLLGRLEIYPILIVLANIIRRR